MGLRPNNKQQAQNKQYSNSKKIFTNSKINKHTFFFFNKEKKNNKSEKATYLLRTPEASRKTPSRHQPQGTPALTSKR
jgi:hypothetical protein